MDEYLDAARLGRIVIHESCHIGARSIILPNVEIGPRTIVGAGSVVTRSLPPDTVCAGSPAVVVCTLEEYLEKHRARIQNATTFDYETYDIAVITDDGRAEMLRALATGGAYMTGGHSGELAGRGGTDRTPPPK
jgi:maltose O-acetyltransferase